MGGLAPAQNPNPYPLPPWACADARTREARRVTLINVVCSVDSQVTLINVMVWLNGLADGPRWSALAGVCCLLDCQAETRTPPHQGKRRCGGGVR